MTARRIGFVWDNFGPLHVDRCNAVAAGDKAEVFGYELFATSAQYDWVQPVAESFTKRTLFADGDWAKRSAPRIAAALVDAILSDRCEAVFLAHYDQPAILLAAIRLRLRGVAAFTMGCSKYDDAPRKAWREWMKRQFHRPYLGGIGSPDRSMAYMRRLGLPADRVKPGYNTVDQARIRRLAEPCDGGDLPFSERPFLAVARLIPEKNFPGLFRAYRTYLDRTYLDQGAEPRRLCIAGSGPLEGTLKALALELGIADRIDWLGFVQTERVASLMRDSLCLVLPSVSETFGNVVPEALALDLPVLASTQCGAVDRLVRSGASGFTFAPGDDAALAEWLERVGNDEKLWGDLRRGARELAPMGDASVFAQSVFELVGLA